MVIVKLENLKTGEKKEFYMDGWLKGRLDAKIKPAITKMSEDYVLIIDGKERSGKSTLAQQIGAYIDPTLIGDLSKVCITPDEFREKITKSKDECVIYDEAGRGMSAKGALSEVNKILAGMMQEMGQRHLFVIIVLPTFFELQKYQALWRARVLLHTYKRRGKKGSWRFIGSKAKQKIYLEGKKSYNYNIVRSKRRGTFLKGYMVDEKKYEEKKNVAFKESYGKTPIRIKYREQRDVLVYAMNKKLGMKQDEICDVLKSCGFDASQQMISTIIKKYKENLTINQPAPLD